MTLQEFIDKMKNGWGFRNPYRVKIIGYALDLNLPDYIRDREVHVSYESSHSGYGPNFHHHYTWDVAGDGLAKDIEDVDDTRFEVTRLQEYFGYMLEYRPYFAKTPRGFVVGYSW